VSSTPSIERPATQPASLLEKARARSTEAHSRLEAARGKLADVDGQIGRLTAQAGSDETALRSAMDEVKRLKKALKDGEKQRRKLVTARKRAEDAAAKAEERAHKAEAKYDRAVLADLIQRQKESDRKTASGKAPQNGSAAPALHVPMDAGTSTARETAARVTAESAGDGVPRATELPRSTTPRRPPAARGTTPRVRGAGSR
jgi:chromosome segregation ATPase